MKHTLLSDAAKHSTKAFGLAKVEQTLEAALRQAVICEGEDILCRHLRHHLSRVAARRRRVMRKPPREAL